MEWLVRSLKGYLQVFTGFSLMFRCFYTGYPKTRRERLGVHLPANFHIGFHLALAIPKDTSEARDDGEDKLSTCYCSRSPFRISVEIFVPQYRLDYHEHNLDRLTLFEICHYALPCDGLLGVNAQPFPPRLRSFLFQQDFCQIFM